jgi:hypothetical protein
VEINELFSETVVTLVVPLPARRFDVRLGPSCISGSNERVFRAGQRLRRDKQIDVGGGSQMR